MTGTVQDAVARLRDMPPNSIVVLSSGPVNERATRHVLAWKAMLGDWDVIDAKGNFTTRVDDPVAVATEALGSVAVVTRMVRADEALRDRAVLIEARVAAIRERDAARAVIAEVMAMHPRVSALGQHDSCGACRNIWPCATVAALAHDAPAWPQVIHLGAAARQPNGDLVTEWFEGGLPVGEYIVTVDLPRGAAAPADGREPSCVSSWPECHNGGYDPRCCRFPKSCSVRDLPTAAEPWTDPKPWVDPVSGQRTMFRPNVNPGNYMKKPRTREQYDAEEAQK